MSCCSGTTSTGFAFESPSKALEALCDEIAPVGTELIRWDRAPGRVLAADVQSDRPSPSCDVSAMDGYAIRGEHCTPGTLRVAGEIRIGEQPQPMPADCALKIVTGAPIPDGVHAVIKREDVTELDGAINLSQNAIDSITPGANIRRLGENMPAGEVVRCAGRVITSPLMGMLTGFGVTNPAVYKNVKLGVITTGNEVVEPDSQPTQWQLRDSNAPSILSMCAQHRWIKQESHVHAIDTFEEIRSTAERLLQDCDALVFTGGVSMGDHDHVPKVVDALGSRAIFHKLPQRPGKPALGAVLDGKPILGLPGNPVSVMVTTHRLLIPALAVRAGIAAPISTPSMMRIVNSDDKSLGLSWSRLARLVSDTDIELIRS